MKVQYVGYEKVNDDYRIFLLKQNNRDNSEGMKPVLKFSNGIGLYFPKVNTLPKCKIGDIIEIYFDERGNIIYPV